MASRVVSGVMLVVLLSAAAVSLAASPEWSLDRGWLVANQDGHSLLSSQDTPSLDFQINDRSWAATVTEPAAVAASATLLEARYRTPLGEAVDRYERFPGMGNDAWLRTVTYTNSSATVQDLTKVRLSVAPIPYPNRQVWNPQYFWMGEVQPGVALCLSYRGTTDFHALTVDAKGLPSHAIDAAWRLAPGQSATIGAQGIWLGQAGREEFRNEAARWFKAIDLRAAPAPRWLDSAILYEVNAGGHIDSRFSDGGGFDALARQVPYLAALGVNAVWLQGVEQHKTPPNPVQGGWNLYDPLDFSKVDPILGGPEALDRLMKAFTKEKMRVLGELVPHGGHSVQALALEPWWTCGRDGKPQRNWGGCAMDYSSPAWQDAMREHARMLARDFGMVGARIDVADGSGPNWKSPVSNQASLSTLPGSINMLSAIKQGFAEFGRDVPLIIPEAFNTLEYFRVSPVGYGFASTMVLARDLPPLAEDAPAMVARLRQHLETERGSYPEGVRLLRTLNNHDTTCETGRVAYRYGSGLARALYGVCLMIPGIPMMYQEEEIGSFTALQRLNWAYRNIPELSTGRVDYDGAAFAPEVFSCLRTGRHASALGLSNLSGKRISGRVSLRDLRDTTAIDAVTGRHAKLVEGSFDWTLEPYETALFRIGQPPLELAPEPVPAPEPVGTEPTTAPLHWNLAGMQLDLRVGTKPWTETENINGTSRFTNADGTIDVQRNGDALEITCDSSVTPELLCLNAATWAVSGRTALLEEPVLRRHYPFPADTGYTWERKMAWVMVPLYNGVCPSGRLWQSVMEPLHPQNPRLSFESRSGECLVLTVTDTTARNIVLTDRSDEPNVQPYGLALRFHGTDPDLNPRVTTTGIGQPWVMDRYPPPSSERQKLSLRLEVTPPEKADELLAATRLPINRGAARLEVNEQHSTQGQNAVWLIQPGTATWQNLAPVPGRYRIRLELRHSERTAKDNELADAYAITLDGRPLAIEWGRMDTFHTGNAYFGQATTQAVDLSTSRHVLSIKTDRPWCAVRNTFHLLPSE